ncbi:MAG: 2-nitropropane dioxygenase [Chloroflexota bacterium]|nr:MAG: 2-nitropropane dioxygenase [Chloroflexota bacterium]
MTLPMIIQGGMGVAISNWRLAKTVSQAGQLGVVSGTGMSRILVSRLMEGDEGGHMRRALAHFPFQAPVEHILNTYYVEGGKAPDTPYLNIPAYSLKPTKALDILTIIANFVEVFLAKEGHDGVVGINLLEKVQLPNLASLYGAMLAGVDYVLMGAGIPMQVAGVLDRLVNHESVSYRVDVVGATAEDDYRIHLHPEELFPGIGEQMGSLKRPAFLPIISSLVLAQALLKRSEGSIQGFVIEGHIAGGHNAPPRGTVSYNEFGEPIYTTKDTVDLEKMKALGLPFWLAGGFGHPEQLRTALEQGAAGIQVGTAFAYCEESGMESHNKQRVLNKVLDEDIIVRTNAVASPTGFPFKVVDLEDTMSEQEVYEVRDRICDMGFLRTIYKRPDGKIGYRCPAEPIDDYVRKGGAVEDTEGRVCLCNALGAAAGFPQTRDSGYVEASIVTSGNDLVNLKAAMKDGSPHYSARDVVQYLLREVAVPQ